MTTPRELTAVIAELVQEVEAFSPGAPEVAPGPATVPLARYRERLTSLETLRTELEALGFSGLRLARLVRIAQLDRDRDYRLTLRDLMYRAFERDQVSETALRSLLAALDHFGPEEAMELTIARLRRALRAQAPPPTPAPSQP